jgi:hypothetical protein
MRLNLPDYPEIRTPAEVKYLGRYLALSNRRRETGLLNKSDGHFHARYIPTV